MLALILPNLRVEDLLQSIDDYIAQKFNIMPTLFAKGCFDNLTQLRLFSGYKSSVIYHPILRKFSYNKNCATFNGPLHTHGLATADNIYFCTELELLVLGYIRDSVRDPTHRHELICKLHDWLPCTAIGSCDVELIRDKGDTDFITSYLEPSLVANCVVNCTSTDNRSAAIEYRHFTRDGSMILTHIFPLARHYVI